MGACPSLRVLLPDFVISDVIEALDCDNSDVLLAKLIRGTSASVALEPIYFALELDTGILTMITYELSLENASSNWSNASAYTC